MQNSQLPVKWVKPFAVDDANKVELPVTTATLGRASQSLGFPPITMQPPESGGVPPQGEDFNGAMNQVARFVWWQLAGGALPFDATWAANAAIGGYPQGARIAAGDLMGEWISTVDNNVANPDTVGTGWVPGSAYGATALTGLTNVNVTLTPAQAAKPVITLAGTLTGNIQIIFPVWRSEWLIVNNTTGAFSVTAKTAAGAGVVVSQAGGQQTVWGDGTNLNALGGNAALPLLVGPATQATQAVTLAQLPIGTRVKGLRGNTVGAGFTTATFSASEVLLRNPTTGVPYLFTTVGPTVCNVALAGPAANGRDQSAAFTNSTWIHFWYITDGTTLATLASASATAPTLPSGYVAQAYIGACRFGVGVLADVDYYGSNTVYNASQVALTNGTASTLTAVNVATLVPPNAMKFDVLIRDFVATPATPSGVTDVTQTLAASSTGAMFRLGFGSVQSSAVNVTTGGQLYPMPNFGQQYYYLVGSGASNPVSSTHHISGYQNPNGGE